MEQCMDEKSGRTTDKAAQPSPPRWKGAQSIGMVYGFNERCIELLCAVAPSSNSQTTSAAIAENRELWINLNIDARRRIAKIPFVIMDANFKRDDWWHRVSQSVVDSALSDSPAAENVGAYSTSGFSPEASKNLMQETIMFAWQLVGSDRTTAIMSFGMVAPVAEIISELTPKEVREISTREHSAVKLRWADDVKLWRDFLLAANAGDDDRLAALHLHAKLLICGDMPEGLS
jgi:hypothetical protein